MPLPSILTFNELNGEEVRQVIENRFRQFLDAVPYFQRHLTLPRVRIAIDMRLEQWADQPHPETVRLKDGFDVVVPFEEAPDGVVEAESVDAAAPIPGGHPPDQIREMHGLPVSRPGPGDRATGSHISTSDNYPNVLDGREVEDLPGLRVSRTGTGVIDGMQTSANATVAKIDQGPAGLRMGQMNRDRWKFGTK